MRKHKNATVYREGSRIFYFALFTCISVLGAYMYLVSVSIVSVVFRKEIDKEISALATTVGRLEATYIEKQHSVSSNFATLHGFVIADKKIFIDRTNDTLVFSRN